MNKISVDLKVLANKAGYTIDEVTSRRSSIHKKKPAKKGHIWIELMYQKKVILGIEAPKEITLEQESALRDMAAKQIRGEG